MTTDEREPRQPNLLDLIHLSQSERELEVDDLMRDAQSPQMVLPFLTGYLMTAVDGATWESAMAAARKRCLPSLRKSL